MRTDAKEGDTFDLSGSFVAVLAMGIRARQILRFRHLCWPRPRLFLYYPEVAGGHRVAGVGGCPAGGCDAASGGSGCGLAAGGDEAGPAPAVPFGRAAAEGPAPGRVALYGLATQAMKLNPEVESLDSRRFGSRSDQYQKNTLSQ